MKSLRQIQRHFKHDLKYRDQKSAQYVFETDGVGADERLDVYCNAYWLRMEEAISEDFEWVREYLGEESFYSLLTDFIRIYGSHYKNISEVSGDLVKFAKNTSPWKENLFLIDLLNLEWAWVRSDTFSRNWKAGQPGSVVKQPSVHVVESDQAVLDWIEGSLDRGAARIQAVIFCDAGKVKIETLNSVGFVILNCIGDVIAVDELSEKLGNLKLSPEAVEQQLMYLASRGWIKLCLA